MLVKRIADRRESGLCEICGRPVGNKQWRCPSCAWEHSQVNKKYNLKNKEAVLLYARKRYGRLKDEGRCPVCGVSLLEDEGVWCSNCIYDSNYGGFRLKGVLKYEAAD